MTIIQENDMFAVIHANHEAAAHRMVVIIPTKEDRLETVPEEPKVLPAVKPAPYTIPGYAWGTTFRMALMFGFSISTKMEWIHPALGGILTLACGIWAVCYWAKRRYNL